MPYSWGPSFLVAVFSLSTFSCCFFRLSSSVLSFWLMLFFSERMLDARETNIAVTLERTWIFLSSEQHERHHMVCMSLVCVYGAQEFFKQKHVRPCTCTCTHYNYTNDWMSHVWTCCYQAKLGVHSTRRQVKNAGQSSHGGTQQNWQNAEPPKPKLQKAWSFDKKECSRHHYGHCSKGRKQSQLTETLPALS